MKYRHAWLCAAAMLGAAPVWAAQPLGCLIEPERAADIGSQVVGVIESIKVERGDVVKRGQILAVLQDQAERAAVAVAKAKQEAEAEVKAAEASLAFARQQFKRSEDLVAKNFISKQALDESRTQTEVAEQKLIQAREQKRIADRELGYVNAQLSQRYIRAPFSGIVAERYMSAGERVEEKPVLRVVQVDPLRVQVVIPVSMYGQIKVGGSASVMPDLPDTAPVLAKVKQVDKIVDPASNTFRVLLHLPNPHLSLPAGLRCTADFAPAAISKTAVAPQADNAKVKVMAAVVKTASASAQPAPIQATPAKAADAKASASPLRAEIARTLDSWLAAWSSKDAEAYLGHYAKDFQTPGGKTRPAWEAERRARIGKAGDIQVTYEDLRVHAAGNERATVTLRQQYRSANYSDTVTKVLELVKQGGLWRILQEKTGQ